MALYLCRGQNGVRAQRLYNRLPNPKVAGNFRFLKAGTPLHIGSCPGVRFSSERPHLDIPNFPVSLQLRLITRTQNGSISSIRFHPTNPDLMLVSSWDTPSPPNSTSVTTYRGGVIHGGMLVRLSSSLYMRDRRAANRVWDERSLDEIAVQRRFRNRCRTNVGLREISGYREHEVERVWWLMVKRRMWSGELDGSWAQFGEVVGRHSRLVYGVPHTSSHIQLKCVNKLPMQFESPTLRGACGVILEGAMRIPIPQRYTVFPEKKRKTEREWDDFVKRM
ncbi:hypothetical protein DFP72DRAFT_850860 [Ephemerocybe angulata]|uniref:Uncharacterized protein n=1 Tax=Ephemerocybe angulata TaxID=980116 RepID=A0A8H6M0Z3_9AGAR|nr:hypothetical protein DFP72DRAFT_850860 [Tulosesus angulatus]